MTNNPYAPPTAKVADVQTHDVASPYFAVSTTKLVVMSICTLLIYDVYWFYKHWKSIKEREGSDIIPLLRAIFSVFFVYSLFANIRDEADRLDVKTLSNIGVATVGWILLTLMGNFSDKYFFVSFLSVFFLVPAQACANRINQQIAPEHDPNSRFSIWNILAIVVGVLMLALIVVGLMLPEEVV